MSMGEIRVGTSPSSSGPSNSILLHWDTRWPTTPPASGDEGGDRDGSANDPRLALVLVEAQSVEYLVTTKPRPVVLFQVAKSMMTGTPPNVGEQRTLTARELHTTAAREAR